MSRISQTSPQRTHSPSLSPESHPSKRQSRQEGNLEEVSSPNDNERPRESINLSIDRHETRSSTFTKYVVYHIKGTDKNGSIDVFRRFNEFYKMRVALVKRFPGCFIPSIPEKSISLIDDEIVNKRQRYLNEFLRRMGRLPHLYLSESAEKDLSGTFEKWPNPTPNDIINKYKDSFSFLSGKVIDSAVKDNLLSFTKLIQRISIYMYRFKILIKSLATERDKFDRALAPLFSKYLPSFERNCISECVARPEELILNSSFAEFANTATEILGSNPYWMLYDLIKREERDGLAFLECAKSIQQFEQRRYELEIRLGENDRSIAEINMGKKSNSQLKYKLQVENEAFKKEKEAVLCLTDIITALVAFVELERFKREKSGFYLYVLQHLAGSQQNQVQSMSTFWSEWKKRAQERL